MQLSDCLAVSNDGLLVYIGYKGYKGDLREVVGGDKDGNLNTRSL